ncbi:hypothetical protein BH24ACI4_BH24ACI4_03100 [soil metagenome]
MKRSPEGPGRRIARWVWRIGVALAVLLLPPSVVQTQEVTEPALKAAFLVNIESFTEWPPDALPASSPVNACVVGDLRQAEALERAGKGRGKSRRSVNVLRVQPDGPLQSCHMLYVSGLTTSQITAVLQAVQNAPVLTIGDADDFRRLGGMLHLFVDTGRIAFNVNLYRARQTRLDLSSRLLGLAQHVHQGSGVPVR